MKFPEATYNQLEVLLAIQHVFFLCDFLLELADFLHIGSSSSADEF